MKATKNTKISKADWKTVKLGEALEFKRGYDLPHAQMVEGQFPVVGSSGIIGWHNEFTTEAPSITIGRSGSVGRPYLHKGKSWSHNTALYIKDFKGNDPFYLYYLLFSIKPWQYGGGSAVPTLNRNDLHGIPISLPPLATQRKIAAVLGSLDDKIENNRKICANLEAQAQALFKSWFVDFEPFGGKMPKDWKMASIEEFATKIASGGTPKTKNESFYQGAVKWYSTKELKDGFLFDSEKHISEEAIANSAAKLFPRNTILMAIYAAPTVGRLGILDSEGTFNQAAVGIVPRKEIGFPYLFLLLKNEREGLNLMAVGSCQQNLNVGVVRSYKALLPDFSTLRGFNELANGWFEEIRVLESESRAIAELRDAMLPRLMSGELDVEEVAV